MVSRTVGPRGTKLLRPQCRSASLPCSVDGSRRASTCEGHLGGHHVEHEAITRACRAKSRPRRAPREGSLVDFGCGCLFRLTTGDSSSTLIKVRQRLIILRAVFSVEMFALRSRGAPRDSPRDEMSSCPVRKTYFYYRGCGDVICRQHRVMTREVP